MSILRLLALGLATALALTACGGDDGGEGGGGEAGGENVVLGDADEGIDGVQAIRVYYSDPVHTESVVEYDLRPPAGGIHNPSWWTCGFYDEPVPDEHLVHNLEHGVVWLAYAPDLPADEVEVIHDIVRGDQRVIATPYPDLEAGEAVVVTAWARQLRLDSADDPRLGEFVRQYQDGSQAPESGASCEGSLGTPIP